jgi:hypothetical protein
MEDKLDIVSNLMHELREMDNPVRIVIYSDFSGHLESTGSFENKGIKNSEFYDPDGLVRSLAREIQNRIHREQYSKTILEKFKEKVFGK